jgi:hypothetical protein
MAGLLFETRPAPPIAAPNRADVACFIGLVPLRPQRTPAGNPDPAPPEPPQALESWEAFDQRYAWDQRPLELADPSDGVASDGRRRFCATYLGAAVRSFFAQGGRRCFVVRVGDPLPVHLSSPTRVQRQIWERQRQALLAALLPGFPRDLSPTPLDRSSWRGIGALLGLPEVSFVALPDLADLVALDRTPIAPLPTAALPEWFVECGVSIDKPRDREGVRLAAPRSDPRGYGQWGLAVSAAAGFLRRWCREVQVIAALPLPQEGEDIRRVLPPSLSSGFAQLVFPWVRTPLSPQLPGGLESPEGVLVGLLARQALQRGSFRSAAGLDLADVRAVEPILTRQQRLAPLAMGSNAALPLSDRVSLLGPTPQGLRLLTDVTTSLDPSYRLASVHRLVTAVLRAARTLGELHSFETSNEALWRRLQNSLETLMTQLWQSGALAGASPREAFQVRCDRTTTQPQDLDAGRVVAEVVFVAALPIEEIRLVLAMEEGGQVSLQSPPS